MIPHPSAAELRQTAVRLPREATAVFLSDLHFGDGSTTDLFRGQDEALVAFLEDQRQRVETIVFLGDIFDLPQAWRTARIEAAHGPLLAYLRELARAHRVIFVRGNHDWSVDYAAQFPGATCTEALLIGERILAWHGHQMDLLMNPGMPDATAKTYVHALAERLVGSRLIPPLEQHDSTANRIALGLAVAWSRLSLARAGGLRRLGREAGAAALEAQVRYLARSVTGDPADVFGATSRAMLGHDFETVVCGHTHLPGVTRSASGEYVNTGTWTCGQRTCASWTGEHFEVHDLLSGRQIHDEHYAAIPPQTTPADLFAWWRSRPGMQATRG